MPTRPATVRMTDNAVTRAASGRRIAVTPSFAKALAKLGNQDEKAARICLSELLLNPEASGLNIEALRGQAKKNGWSSARCSRSIRIIFGNAEPVWYLAWVDQHDMAYEWACRHKFRLHDNCPQIYVLPEFVHEAVPAEAEAPSTAPAAPAIGDGAPSGELSIIAGGPSSSPREGPFARVEDRILLNLGVPPEWVPPIRALGSRAELEELIGKLPDPVWERLVDLADGKAPALPAQRELGFDPLADPDTRRAAFEVTSEAELERLFSMRWEAWELFLHPDQRSAVEADHAGPCLIRGGAGTGKTVVAVHRAARLARRANSGRVLLASYSTTLAEDLARRLRRLLSGEGDREARARVDVVNVDRLLHRLGRELLDLGERSVTSEETQRALLVAAAGRAGCSLGEQFLWEEWNSVVDFWGIESEEAYRQASREGRKTPLPPDERARLWPVFAEVIATLREQRRHTWASLARAVTARLREEGAARYAHVVVDEAQDLGPAQLTFLRALARPGTNDLTLVADPGQQIYKRSFSWLAAGIDIRGRSTRLRWSYRNARAIAQFGAVIRGCPPDGEESHPIGARTAGRVFLRGVLDPVEEVELVAKWITWLRGKGFEADEIAIFARTMAYVRSVGAEAARRAGVPTRELGEKGGRTGGPAIALGTMHRAKGLEHRAVAVVGCGADLVPLTRILDKVSDPGERELALERERNLLYVAATRAREVLLVSWVGKPSPFLPAEAPAPGTAAG